MLRGLLALIMAAGTGGGFLADDIATHACPIAQVWRGRPVGRRNGPKEKMTCIHLNLCGVRRRASCQMKVCMRDTPNASDTPNGNQRETPTTRFCCMGCIRMPCVARRSAWRPCLVQSEAVLPRPKTAYGWPVTVASAEKGHGAAHGGRWEAPGRRLRASVPSAAARDASYDDARVGENELHQHLPP